jgi:uncharacterized protein (TIGR02268 family)
MRAQALAVLLALFASASIAAPPRASPCELGIRRIELSPELVGELHTLCIGPRLATLLVFYGAELARDGVVLEGRERFAWVEVGDTVLRLEPSDQVIPGERFRVTIRFRDKALPASVTLWLEVHPTRLEPLVEVHRHKRTVESCQQEVHEKDVQLRQCQGENEQLRVAQGVPEGLAGLLTSGIVGERGVVTARLNLSAHPSLSHALIQVVQGRVYRSETRVVVELVMAVAPEQASWTAGEVELVGPGRRALRVLRTWQRGPIGADAKDPRVWIEAEATGEESRGTFTLKVWEAWGPRSLTVTGVKFP